LGERLEQPLDPVGGNANPGVDDVDAQLHGPLVHSVGEGPQGDLTAVGGELDRVPRQVDEHLPQPGGIAPQTNRGRVVDHIGQVQTLGRGGGSDDIERSLDAIAQIERGDVEFDAPGFDL
jgi:hypothetical protein